MGETGLGSMVPIVNGDRLLKSVAFGVASTKVVYESGRELRTGVS
jgi:hypothetical protein